MIWKLKPKAPSAFLKQFPEYSPLVVQLFYERGLKNQKQIDEFFNPDYQQDIHNPFLLKGMEKAVKRILKAVEKKEKITIYGDFDADGVCSTAILFLTLKKLGVKEPKIYIPDRDKEGHGFNKEAVKGLAKNRVNLIITVDCGCTDLEEVDLANSLGIDVIITDHHTLRDESPKAAAIINPLQKNDKYPFKKLAGAGVAYKLACALLSTSKQTPELKKWLLDLTAIATVVDMMPLIGENRTLVKYGLGVLAQTQWIGLRELMKVAQVVPKVIRTSLNGEPPSTNLNVHTLSFVLGPRLNAAGRMDHANAAFHLLTAQNKKTAENLAKQLSQSNINRQNLTSKIVQEIESRLREKFSQSKKPKLIFEGSPDWPVGLVGLAAGKIAEKYHRPTVIYQQKKDIIDASCRTIPGFDLIKVLEQCSDFLDDFGGHKAAAGFQIKNKNLSKVKKVFSQMSEKIKEKDTISVLDIDAELLIEEISWQNYDQIQNFAPFGKGNPEPRFLAKKLEVADLRIVGNGGKHLKLDLIMFDRDSGIAKNFNAIGFGLGEWQEKLKKGDLIDVVFELVANEWNDYRSLEMKIIDIKL